MAVKTKLINKSMKNKLKRYYTVEDILKTNSTYNLIFAGRNRGKSRDAKRYTMEEAYLRNNLLGLIFRTDKGKETNTSIEKYFADMTVQGEISRITKGKYDRIKVKARDLYFYKEEEDELVEVEDKQGNVKWKTIKGKKTYGPLLGHILFLDNEQAYKSLIFPNVQNLVFEEIFLKAEKKNGNITYLEGEVEKLDSLVSTVFRNNRNGRVFLIGNLHSTVNPYTSAWGLRDMFKQQPDTIQLYVLDSSVEDKKISLAVERVKNNEEQQQIYATTKKGQMQESGEWEVGDYLTPNKVDLTGFIKRYEFVFTYMGFYFFCEFRAKGNDLILYITRKTTPIQPNTRVIGDIPSTSILYTADFKPLVQREAIVFNLLFQDKIVFADNNTGEDFYVAFNTMLKNA